MKIRFVFITITLLLALNCYPDINHPYYLYSENKAYFLKSIPHNDQEYEIEGRTDVFKGSDSSFLYSIDRYFTSERVILSNDGTSILYAEFSNFWYRGIDDRILLFYKHGILKYSFSVDELIQKDEEEGIYYVIYRNHDLYEWNRELRQREYNDTVRPYLQKILEDPFYSHDSIAYLATQDEELILISLNSGRIITRRSLWQSEDMINSSFSEQIIIKPNFEVLYDLPNLANGLSYKEAFAKEFSLAYDGRKRYKNDHYKYFRLELVCYIDYDGNCLTAKIDYEDSTMNKVIEKFFLLSKFEKSEELKIVERFYIDDVSYYRRVDTAIAKQERIIEKEQEYRYWLSRIKQDSIDGVYIPKDFDDCMKSLDNLLSDQVKEDFKKSDPIMYHMGLGRWIRNHWGLWGGSRLERYFVGLGVSHPDDMSGIILNGYHLYLNNMPYSLTQFIEEYSVPINLEERQIDTIHFRY